MFSEGILARICSVTSRKFPPHQACLARMVVPRATTANKIAMAAGRVRAGVRGESGQWLTER